MYMAQNNMVEQPMENILSRFDNPGVIMFYSASFWSNLKNETYKLIYKMPVIWKYNQFLVLS